MKACKTPKSLKKGDVLYSFEGVSYTDGTSSVEAHEWIVRSIQKRDTYRSECGLRLKSVMRKAVFVNLFSKKKDVTWVSGTWASYIPQDYQLKFELGDELPEGVYTTPLKAINFAVKKWEADVEEVKGEIADAESESDAELWADDLQRYSKELKLLKGRQTRINNLRKKAAAA